MASTSFRDLIDSATPVVVDFYADWCGPCKMQGPILNQLKQSAGEKVRIVKIDIDKNQQLSSKLGVSSIPTIMIFQNGELKWQGVGVQTKQILQDQIDNLADV